MMKRTDYQRPQIDIVEIKQKACLMAGSESSESGQAGVRDYKRRSEEEW